MIKISSDSPNLAIMTFDLSEAHTTEKFNRAMRADDTHYDLKELDNQLRSITKYGSTTLFEKPFDSVESLAMGIRTYLNRILERSEL